MKEADLYREAYNAHEWAEDAVLTALRSSLEAQSTDALATLCDPSWGWKARSTVSALILEIANDVLNERLDALVAA